MINRIVILQPCYLPWLGYFDQIQRSNKFIFFDDVQFARRSWQSRNNIKDLKTEEQKLITVPVNTKNQYHSLVKDITINFDKDWVSHHLEIIRQNYKRAVFFNEFYPLLEKLYQEKHDRIADLNISFIKKISDYLGIKSVQFFRSSDLKIGSYKNPTEHLIKICENMKATHYLTGDSAKNYLDEEAFKKKNIILEYHNYTHPSYQQFGSKFVPFMSIIDLIFNEGPNSLEILSNKKV